MARSPDLEVLCLDPDPSARDAAVAAIEAAGDMSAVGVATAAEAERVLADRDVDCVVAEYDLGETTGMDLFEEVRATDRSVGCVLFTDAAVADLDTARFGQVVAEYLPKDTPAAHDRLRELVRNVVVNRMQVGYPVPDAETERLAAVRRYDLPNLSTLETFDRLTRLVASHFDVDVSFVGLVTDHEERFLACHGADWETLEREDSVCSYAMLEDGVTVIEDVQADPRFEDNDTLRELGVVSYAGANLTTPAGHTVGELCLIDHEPRSYDEIDLADLRLFADEVVEQLELRRRLRQGDGVRRE